MANLKKRKPRPAQAKTFTLGYKGNEKK